MFYYASKILWLLAQPSNVLVMVFAGAFLALLRGRRQLALWLLGPAAVVLIAISLIPLGQWLLLPLENRFPAVARPPEQVDGIIVLGGALDWEVAQSRGSVEFKESAERNIALLELAQHYPNAVLVFTGGRGELLSRGISEAAVMREFTRRHGLDGRVLFEDRSRNTYENAVFSKLLATPEPGEQWLLVTSASHMPRSVGVFRQVGWPVIPYPVDYRTTGEINLLELPDAAERWREFDQGLKSWVGLFAYWLSGRSNSPFPAP